MNGKRNLLIIAATIAVLFLAAIGIAAVASGPSPVNAAENVLKVVTLQGDDDSDEVEDGNDAGETSEDDDLAGSVSVNEGQNDLQSLAQISAEQAEKIAVEANPGTQVREVELEAEAGYLVYEVELDNGAEVVVDAGDGAILHSEIDD